ncbi:MAG TPA: hypothetical protein VKY29_07240 [Cryomorphaceae bacterium]|nr:hypothetical protein [Cryomorphaceae bacterium]
MRFILYISLFGLSAIFLAGCSGPGGTMASAMPENTQKIFIDASAPRSVGNPVYIRDAEIINDHLVLSVSYSGGCEDHDFALNSRGDYAATYPPELKVTLFHDSHGDRCRSTIDTKLWFDLTPAQYPGTNRVLLILTNTDKTITYTY